MKEEAGSDLIDPKNGLAKPGVFKYRLITEMQRAERLSATFCLAVLHFDTPKINSVMYPKEVFTPQISNAIITTIRNIDIACIDERNDYIILLTEATADSATIVIKRILDKLVFLKSENIETKVAIGIANFPGDSKTVDELIQSAKYAMFISQQKKNNDIITVASTRQCLTWEKETNDALILTKKKLNIVVESTIRSLLSTFALKDNYLQEHSLQVSRIASLLAEYLEIKEKYVHEITLAALLHDVGILQIPNNILHKKGSLSEQEMEIIRQHPLTAVENILKPVESLENLLPIIADHHERWDGKGYPRQKAERQIHIGSRILSIADAYHALTSDRPYRKALSNDQIIEILNQSINSVWEEKLVKSFIELLSDQNTNKLLMDRRN